MEMFYWNVVDVDTFLKTFRAGNYFLELDPLEGAVEYINKLKEEGNEIYFITRRQNTLKMKHMTKKWLKKQGFKYDKVFFYIKDKGKFGSELGLDLFIDNDEKNVYEAEEYGIKSYLMETKYNKEISDLEETVNCYEEYKTVLSDIDEAKEMIALANKNIKQKGIILKSLGNRKFDIIVANMVFQDVYDLEALLKILETIVLYKFEEPFIE